MFNKQEPSSRPAAGAGRTNLSPRAAWLLALLLVVLGGGATLARQFWPPVREGASSVDRRFAYYSAPARSLEGTTTAATSAPANVDPRSLPRAEVIPLGPSKVPLAGQDTDGDVQLESRGGLISLIVRDAPLDKVLGVLAKNERRNIVATNNLNARVSITLDKVPLEAVLDAICSVAGYTWVLHNNIIHVTSVAGASTLPPEVQGRRVQVFHLDFASAEDIAPVITGFLSPAGKSYSSTIISTDNRRTQEVIVVEDLPPYLARIEQFLAQVDQPPRQVLIETHVLSVELSDDNRHGVNFDHLFQSNGRTLTLETTGLANPAASQAFFFTLDGSDLNLLVEALKTTTDAKTLASPRVLVVNGQEARIQVGEQLGFRVTTTTETSTLESVNFLDVGVVLRVVPRISRDGRVLMHVKPEVSSGEVNPDTGLPEEETTEVETDVLLKNGHGVVIGGLIQEKIIDSQSKIPILGDTWLTGTLFQRRAVNKSRNEIIIALVARVVPFDPDYEQFHRIQYDRSQAALLAGPLRRNFRPWEPRLPDAVYNPHLRMERLPPISVYPGRYVTPRAPMQFDPSQRQWPPRRPPSFGPRYHGVSPHDAVGVELYGPPPSDGYYSPEEPASSAHELIEPAPALEILTRLPAANPSPAASVPRRGHTPWRLPRGFWGPDCR